MRAKNISFETGMKLKINRKSSYGSEYDEIKNYEVVKLRNYKRGQKVHIKDLELGYHASFWQDEYPHEILEVSR